MELGFYCDVGYFQRITNARRKNQESMIALFATKSERSQLTDLEWLY